MIVGPHKVVTVGVRDTRVKGRTHTLRRHCLAFLRVQPPLPPPARCMRAYLSDVRLSMCPQAAMDQVRHHFRGAALALEAAEELSPLLIRSALDDHEEDEEDEEEPTEY